MQTGGPGRTARFFILIKKKLLLLHRQFTGAMWAPSSVDRDLRLAERAYLGRGSRSRDHDLLLGHLSQPVHRPHHEENDERDEEEIDDRSEEQSDIDGRRPGSFGSVECRILRATEIDVKAGEIHARQQQTNRGHQDVVDKRRDDLADRPADDDTDSQVNHATLHSEPFELIPHGSPPRASGDDSALAAVSALHKPRSLSIA